MAVKTHVAADVPRPDPSMSVTLASCNDAVSDKLLVNGPLHDSIRVPDTTCDACVFCNDVCGNPDCLSCDKRSECSSLSRCDPNPAFPFLTIGKKCDSSERYYTMCQLKRHCTMESAWILVGDTIYDATPFLEIHPGGKQSILRKSGGACDCEMDMTFHSKAAIRRMKSRKVGKLRKCEREAVLLEDVKQGATDDQCTIS